MKRAILKATLSCIVSSAVITAYAGGPEIPAPLVIPGFYISLGGSASSIQKKVWVDTYRTYVNVVQSLTFNTYTNDFVLDNENKLAPLVDIGYWAPINGGDWCWGIEAIYKFLDFHSNGDVVFLPNASAGVNTFTNGDFDVLVHNRVKHEFMIFPYLGIQYDKGFAYFGIGPALLTIYNTLRINGVNAFTPASGGGGGTNLFYPVNLTVNNTVWGGAAQIGYNYYFRPDWFMNFNYTYLVTAQRSFNSSTTNITLFPNDPFGSPSAPINFNRRERVTVQEFMWSINHVFAF